jgi:hypothetical protein
MTKRKPTPKEEVEVEIPSEEPHLKLPPHPRSVSTRPPPLPSTYSSLRRESSSSPLPPIAKKQDTIPFSSLITPPPPPNSFKKEAKSGTITVPPNKPPPDLFKEELKQAALVVRNEEIIIQMALKYNIHLDHSEKWIKVMVQAKLTDVISRIKYREMSETCRNKNQLMEVSWQFLQDHEKRHHRNRNVITQPETFPKTTKAIAMPEKLDSDKNKK